MDNIEMIKKVRSAVRRSVTKLCNQVTREFDKPDRDQEAISAFIELINNRMTELKELDCKVLDALYDDPNCDEGTVDEEQNTIDEYERKTTVLRLRALKINEASGMTGTNTALSSSGEDARRYRLPKIELRKFNGDFKEWLGFWASFSKIHEDPSLHDNDKFHYLVQSMEVGSRAHDLVGSYPQTAGNYSKVIEALKQRFGREKLLKQVYVRELLKLVIDNANTKQVVKVSQMYDKLETHLRALETLGVTTEQTATFLYPMVESSLPEELMVAWQRSVNYGKEGPTDPNNPENLTRSELDYLMDFLRHEVESEDQRNLARGGFVDSFVERQKNKSPKVPHWKEETPTAMGLFSSQSSSCIFCGKYHDSQLCSKAHSMSLDEKKVCAKGKKACFNCLKTGHMAKRCKVPVKCLICRKGHTTLMCPETSVDGKETSTKEATVVQSGMASCSGDVVLQTVFAVIRNKGVTRKVRVMFDTGSQRTYILKKTAERLGLQPVKEMKLCHMLFGCAKEFRDHKMYQVDIGNVGGSFRQRIHVLDHHQMCEVVPRVPKGPWLKELQTRKIWVEDVGEEPSEIEILIGNDLYGKLLTGRIHQLENGLTAIETKLGWAISGQQSDLDVRDSLSMSVISMKQSEVTISDLWELDLIGIRDPIEPTSKSKREEQAKIHFEQHVSQSSDGRYTVGLPWIQESVGIPNNFEIAQRRLWSTTRKLTEKGQVDNYSKVFTSWLQEGIIEKVPDNEIDDNAHYLPHHPVFKPESLTTPIRPVFDASCKSGRSPSLNDCLEKGPNLIELLSTIINRFRVGNIGVIADIRKAFLMIEVRKEDRNYLRFLWWKDSSLTETVIYRHKRVVFGLNCSPFLLAAVIELHLRTVSVDEKGVAEKLQGALYVDNCVTSVDSEWELEEFKSKATEILAAARMELRQWAWSIQDGTGTDLLLDHQHGVSTSGKFNSIIIPVLGLIWDRQSDCLTIDTKYSDLCEPITKRTILTRLHRVFDPIGVLCPVLLIPKLILQEINKYGWDDDLPEEPVARFENWAQELPILNYAQIPRNMTQGITNPDDWQLHCFCDASKDAYACVIFLRVQGSDCISVQLIQAKSRVAPLKKATIPRLELLGCYIGACLMKFVLESLNLVTIPRFYWSDSATALAWIHRNDDWGTFVGNRVRSILTMSKPEEWRFVPGSMNPADLPSRGCKASQLLESEWWEGPKWLKNPSELWPSRKYSAVDGDVYQEKRKTTICAASIEVPDMWYMRFATFNKNLNMVAWIRRFIHNAHPRSRSERKWGKLEPEEIQHTETMLLKIIQTECFPKVGSVISGIRVASKDGLLRVRTRLLYMNDSFGFREPILLPHRHPAVDSIILEAHIHNSHGGVQFLMGHLREKFWIIQSRKAIRRVIKSCLICARYNSKKVEVPVPPLPKDRVATARVFEVCGVDLAGPLFLKDGSKAYIVLFTCAVYRCIHLELTTSLSTTAFLLALRRFIDRRGRPTTVYSDNGTNFVGSDNLFRELDWEEIELEYNVRKIQWKFIPPSAAWWGGWWERLVRSVKDVLRRVLGRATLNYEELMTCVCDAESVINRRPLTYVTEDPDDLVPLTPAMLLKDMVEDRTPDLDILEKTSTQRKLRHLNRVREAFKSRFRKEYLGILVQRGKEKSPAEIKVGDLVLVETAKKRIEWPTARIIDLITGADGNIRVAKLKTSAGVLVRPIQRLYPLEVSTADEHYALITGKGQEEESGESVSEVISDEKEPLKTKCGRAVKRPARYWND